MRPDDSPMRYVGMLHRYTKLHLSRLLEPLGVPGHTLSYLMQLYRQEDVSQDELTQADYRDPASTTRSLTKLEDAGLITRQACEKDKRVKRVRLTDKGRQLEPELRAVLEGWSDMLTKELTDDEYTMAIELLGRMAENARTAVGAEPVPSYRPSEEE